MPKTKFQDLVFTLIMVFSMVYCMTLFNMAWEIGFTYKTFLNALLGMWPEFIGAFIAQRYIAGPFARKKVMSWFQPGVDKPILMTVAMAGCTVCVMAPIMTLYVAILHNGFVGDLPLLWLPKLVQNFPFALIIQLFYVGPFVRFVFKLIFREKEVQAQTTEN
ncbi:DUF2798 domain-containing protein [Eubacteriaceae bacterium ES2]|nr:DUF2798 domain-containing protein [Eubacteriaceae bacterium ES2]